MVQLVPCRRWQSSEAVASFIPFCQIGVKSAEFVLNAPLSSVICR
jgi:hypothetical protein